MKHHNVRGRLIERTIAVIAENGLDKTTTKAIVKGTDLNEAYIYSHFSDKEDLLAQAFAALDEELVTVAMLHVPVMYQTELNYELRCRLYFGAMWRFLLGNREKCLAFIRYYYSPYFGKYSAPAHRRRYRPLGEKFADAFGEKTHIWMLLHHILNMMLDFAVKVFSDELPNDDNTAEHVFRLVYHSIMPYFKKEENRLLPASRVQGRGETKTQ